MRGKAKKISRICTDLTTGSEWKRLLLYFLPILAGSLFQQLYTTVDAVILGQMAGKTGLASIDAICSLLRLPVNFFVGLSAGTTIMISQFFGAKDHKSLSKAVHTGVVFAFAGGIILSVIGVAAAPFCLRAMNVPEEIFGLSLFYVRIIFGGFALSMLYNIGAGILRAVGDSKTPFYVLIAAGCVNIVLDLVFVGMFKMNAPGAALATVISQGISAVLVLAVLFKSNAPYRIKYRELRLDTRMMRSICRLGLPVGLQSALYPISNMLVQSSINETGTDNIAAWALCGKLDFMIWLITDSLASAVATFVAQNYGAKAFGRVTRGVRIGIVLTAGLIEAISIILFFWGADIGALFINAEDINIAFIAGGIMSFIAPTYVLYVFGEVFAGAIRGMGETFKPMLITLIGTCVTRILWILIIVPRYQSFLVILGCYPFSWAVSAVAFTIYYTKYRKKIFLHVEESAKQDAE